jgi:hypothetical protein
MLQHLVVPVSINRKHTSNHSGAYLFSRQPIATLVDQQLAHQVSLLRLQTGQDLFPGFPGILRESHLAPVGQSSCFLMVHKQVSSQITKVPRAGPCKPHPNPTANLMKGQRKERTKPTGQTSKSGVPRVSKILLISASSLPRSPESNMVRLPRPSTCAATHPAAHMSSLLP